MWADVRMRGAAEPLWRGCPVAPLPQSCEVRNYVFSFRSRISPTSAGFALPLLSFMTWPLRELSAASLPAL